VVDAALRGGAHGARMTGGGFGGCAIALVSTDRLDRVAETVSEALPQAELFTVVADRGAYQVL
jgi:galactokinase